MKNARMLVVVHTHTHTGNLINEKVSMNNALLIIDFYGG